MSIVVQCRRVAAIKSCAKLQILLLKSDTCTDTNFNLITEYDDTATTWIQITEFNTNSYITKHLKRKGIKNFHNKNHNNPLPPTHPQTTNQIPSGIGPF